MKITSENQILFFKNNEIIRFESVANNTIINFINRTSFEIHEPIDSIEKQLTDVDFIRIHDKHIVNVNYIARIAGGRDDFVELSNAEVLPIKKKQKEIIVELISTQLEKPFKK